MKSKINHIIENENTEPKYIKKELNIDITREYKALLTGELILFIC